MTRPDFPIDDDRILEEAARWHHRGASEGGSSRSDEFDSWLAADDRHGHAFAEIIRLSETVAAYSAAPEMQALRTETLSWVARRARARRMIAAGMALAASIALFLWSPLPIDLAPDPIAKTYATKPGERLVVTLDDGSTATLDVGSRLTVDFGENERRLELLSGQALFEVARNDPRPFAVISGGRRIVAHGTIFNVWRRPKGLRVILVEGSVGVSPGAAGIGQAIMMHPNDVLDATGSRTSVRADANAAALISWREGLLQFESATLTEALEAINRYTSRPVELADPALGAVKISGVFHAGDLPAFLGAIEASLDIIVVKRDSRRILLGDRPPE